jgi:hypothetical protein
MKTIALFSFAASTLTILSSLGLGCSAAPGNVGTETEGASASCGVASDCTGFLPRNVEECSDGTSAGASWSCVKDKCEITYCSSSSKAPSTNSCNTSSDCTGSLPRNIETCGDGTTAGASWGCVANTCTIEYCSSSHAAPPANSCNTSSDCSGLLPRNVEGCPDGSTSGASWGCVANQCEIQYCVDSSTSSSDAGSGSSSDSGFEGDGGF